MTSPCARAVRIARLPRVTRLRAAQPRAAPPLATQPGVTPPAVAPDTEAVPEATTQLGFPWCVIVWDDPVNLMSYVVYVFQKLFGFSLQKATKHMLEVHQQGKSMVATADRERAEFYVTRLHAYGLQATLERSGGE